jgi:DNA-binding GntR family transcriptional regulator
LTLRANGVMYAKTMSMTRPSAPVPGPLQIQSVVDQVYAAVRARILSGDLPRGSRLRQAALAEELGVSRTPLREALRRLATEGLVEFEPNRGATVAAHDFSDMRHAWQARLAMEPGAARLAAELCDQDAIAEMRRAVEAQRRSSRESGESYEVNRDFHLALVRAAGNPHLIRFAGLLWAPRIGVPIYEMQADNPRSVRRWADEHEAITDAVASGDPDLAERVTRQHLAAWPPVERRP